MRKRHVRDWRFWLDDGWTHLYHETRRTHLLVKGDFRVELGGLKTYEDCYLFLKRQKA